MKKPGGLESTGRIANIHPYKNAANLTGWPSPVCSNADNQTRFLPHCGNWDTKGER